MLNRYLVQKIYHSHADRRRFFNRLKNPFLQAKERTIAHRISIQANGSPARILEIGSGEGSNLFYLKNYLPFSQLVGLDFSSEKLRFMAGWMKSASPVCGDALRLPFKERSFDLVLLRDLLHHVHWDRDRVLVEALRVIKPGGELLLFEGNGNKMLNRIFRALNPVERGMADSTPAKLAALCAQHGHTELEFIEASFLLRAFSSIFCWPDHFGKWLIAPFYASIWAWERGCSWCLPQRFWAYMMISLRPERP